MARVRIRLGTESVVGPYERGRRFRQGVTRAMLFDVLCRALDVLDSLPVDVGEDIRENHAGIGWDAMRAGWESVIVSDDSKMTSYEGA